MTPRSVRHRAARRRRVPWVWWQVPTISPYVDRLRARALPDRCSDLLVDGTPVRVMHVGPMVTGPEHWAPIARAILAARGAWRS